MNQISMIKNCLAILLLLMVNTAYSQISSVEKRMLHNEKPDANSVYMPLEDAKTSPGYQYKSPGIFTIQVNVNENGDNILGDAANEPSIAVDPTDADRIMIGWRQFDNVGSSFRQAGHAYSLDAGQSWTFPGSIDAGVFRSDPVLDCDSEGNFYYNSLTTSGNDFLCTVFKTSAGGLEWDDGTFAQGGDKQWMRIDRSGGIGDGNIYSNWTRGFSYCFPYFFTRSTNGGDSYEDCIAVLGDPYWGTEAIGPDGELYIAGAGEFNDIMVVRSDNAQEAGSVIEWPVYAPVNLDGELNIQPDVNPVGLMGQVWVDCDRSDGPGRGNVYVCAAVDRYSSPDRGDVMFARSTDGGESFEAPIRINTDASTSNTQWFATMSVAPNGRIDVVWLDTRFDPAGHILSALFYSYSLDQGMTWSENEQMSVVFNPHLGWPQQNKMGDYFDMVSDEGGAQLAWANTINGEQDVYYSYITPEMVGVEDESIHNHVDVNVFPNPCSEKLNIRYSLDEAVQIYLSVYDMLGNEVTVLANEFQSSGTHKITYQAQDLPNGVYVISLKIDGTIHRQKVVKSN